MRNAHPTPRCRAAAVAGLLALLAAAAYADNRTENLDVFLVLDKSLSMESKIAAVRDYVDTSIIEDMLIPGDYLCVIDFYGKAEVLLSTVVGSDKSSIEAKINTLRADGRYTDIGGALDKLKEVVAAGDYPDHRKVFMLMTDGIQEAPPTSPYYSPSGKFNHAFLDNAKTIQEQGWKIEILGIGSDTSAEELSKSVSGGFAQVSEKPTAAEIAGKEGNLAGLLQATDLSLAQAGSGGTGLLTFKLASSGYARAQTVLIDAVSLDVSGLPTMQIAHGQRLVVPPGSSVTAKIPVSLAGLAPGSYEGTITFTFTGVTTFTPAVATAAFRVGGSLLSDPWYLGGGGLLVVVLVLLAVLLVRRSAKGSRIAFELTIEADMKQTYRFTLRARQEILIQETPFGYRAVERKVPMPVARVVYGPAGLQLEILRKDRLKAVTMPSSALGERIKTLTSAGKTVYFQFRKA